MRNEYHATYEGYKVLSELAYGNYGVYLESKVSHSRETHNSKHRFLSYIEARELLISYNIKNRRDFRKRALNNEFPEYIPKSPFTVYSSRYRGGWVNWRDFLSNTKPTKQSEEVRKQKAKQRYKSNKINSLRNLRKEFCIAFYTMYYNLPYPCCMCCGDDEDIQFDHINGGGRRMKRKNSDMGRQALYHDITPYLEKGKPVSLFRLLCGKCNTKIGKDGVCDYKKGYGQNHKGLHGKNYNKKLHKKGLIYWDSRSYSWIKEEDLLTTPNIQIRYVEK